MLLKAFHGSKLKKLYASFPTKRIAAGALFFDNKNRLLIIKPSYKKYWSIPGGVVEKEESPYLACQRECKEEVNVWPHKLKLLIIDYKTTFDIKPESLQMIFDGGKLNNAQLKNLRVDNYEIAAYKFVSLNKVYTTLGGAKSELGRRIKQALLAKKNKSIYYLENGYRK